jgi:hypothetical protein
MKKFGNIIPLIFLAAMFGFGFYAFGLYSKVEEQKKENKFLADSLKTKQTEIDGLKNRYDSFMILIQNSAQASGVAPETAKLWDSVKSTSTAITRITDPVRYQTAVKLEQEGYEAIKNNRLDTALAKFSQAGKMLPSLNHVNEIQLKLNENKAKLMLPEYQKEIKAIFIDKNKNNFSPAIPDRTKNVVNPSTAAPSNPVQDKPVTKVDNLQIKQMPVRDTDIKKRALIQSVRDKTYKQYLP